MARLPRISPTGALDRHMRRQFFRLGYAVAGRPLLTAGLALLVSLACLTGLVRFHTEERGDKLWVPQGTLALRRQEYTEDKYGLLFRPSTIAFVARGTGSLATKTAMLEMLAVAEEGYSVVADPVSREDGGDGTPITHEDRCVKTSDENGNVMCQTFSVFNLFYNVAFIERRDDNQVDFFKTVKNSIERLSNQAIRDVLKDPAEFGFDGSPFNADEIIGGTFGSGSSFGVKVLRYIQVANNKAVVKGGKLIDKEADELEKKWTQVLLETSPLLDTRTTDWYVESLYSQTESLLDALYGDLPLFSIGFVLLIFYVILFLGDFHAIRSHMLLAIAAIFTNAVSLGACFGISSATGMFYGPVHQILPLLLLGIGIDDCFHVTRAADAVNQREGSKDKPVRLKIALAMSRSGTAITVTSFTNVAVFLLSAISKLPALRYFALWAAIGIFLAWAFTLTFFTAFLTLDMRRSDSKRRDCCPCFPPVEEVKDLNWFKRPPGGFSRFFGNSFGPFIMRTPIRILLLILLAGGLAAGCYGASQLYLKFRFSFFFPEGSTQRDYQDVIDEYFFPGDPTNVYVKDKDLSSRENQQRLLRLCEPMSGVMARNEWIQGDTVDCWYVPFRNESRMTDENDEVEPSKFADEVRKFVEEGAAGSRYRRNILFNKDQNKVIGCRFSMQYVYRETNDDEVKAMRSVRDSADSVGFGPNGDGDPAAFPYTIFDVFSESYAALPQEIGLSLGLASAAVGIVCFVLVGHPLVALVCVLVVGIIIIDVVGLTHYSGTNLNSVSVITLVLVTGISVDFVVHIARSFLEQVGSRTARSIKALEVMGPPVFYAGFSTFLAIIVLSGAKSYPFQVIFRGFVFLIVLGFIHGLILGPILLSLMGPPSLYSSEEDKRKSEEALEERITKANDASASGRGTEESYSAQIGV